MNECPCINCLMFPICKAQATEYIKECYNLHLPSTERFYGTHLYIDVLKPKCSIIRNWEHKSRINSDRFSIIYKIYDIKILKKRY